MLDVGASNNGNNAVNWGDLDDLEFAGDFSFHCWCVLQAVDAGNAYLMSKYDAAGTKGYILYSVPSAVKKLTLITADGATEQDNANTDIDSDGTSVNSYGMSYDGTNSDFYKAGSPDGTPGHTKNATYHGGKDFRYGSPAGAGSSGSWRAGHLMMWNMALSAADYTTLNGGATIPERASLKFWCKGTNRIDVVGGTTGADVNTVTLYTHASDSYYEAPGGFAYMISHWIPFLVNAGIFGANILHENMDKVLPAMRKIMGCQFFGDWNDYVRILEGTTRRPSFLHLAPTNVL